MNLMVVNTSTVTFTHYFTKLGSLKELLGGKTSSNRLWIIRVAARIERDIICKIIVGEATALGAKQETRHIQLDQTLKYIFPIFFVLGPGA
jgi:hypothetical protein